MHKRRTNMLAGTAAAIVVCAGGAGIAGASNSSSAGGSGSQESGAAEAIHAPDSSGSRLDDGSSLLSQAEITEQEAIAAAQTAASGSLNEVDLEDYQGQLVFNVDVGSHDVKVDASNGTVLASPQDE